MSRHERLPKNKSGGSLHKQLANMLETKAATRLAGGLAAIAVVMAVAVAWGGPGAKKVAEIEMPVDPGTSFTWSTFLGSNWHALDKNQFGGDNVALESSGDAPGNLFIRVNYPSGSASPTVSKKKNRPVGGAQALLVEDGVGPTNDMTLRYAVRFPEAFDFVKGGKLPGLYGGTANSGGDQAEGTDGWSARLMWRADGNGEVYAYLPNAKSQENQSSGSCSRFVNDSGDVKGMSIDRGAFRFDRGEWITIEQHVVLNNPNDTNGKIVLKINGKTVISCNDLSFRTADTLQVDGIFFSTFFGGDDKSWASPRDQYIDFAQFSINAN